MPRTRHLKTSLRAIPMALLILIASACSNHIEGYCEEVTAIHCDRCYACAESDEAASNLCGLSVKTNLEGCRIIFNRVCISEAGAVYSEERGDACRAQLQGRACEAMVADAELPEPCRYFF